MGIASFRVRARHGGGACARARGPYRPYRPRSVPPASHQPATQEPVALSQQPVSQHQPASSQSRPTTLLNDPLTASEGSCCLALHMTSVEEVMARRRALADGRIWADRVLTCGDMRQDAGPESCTASACELWLGAGRDAANLEKLREHKITHILNVADDVPNFHEGKADLTYKCLGVTDFGGDDGISRTFPAAKAFVLDAWAAGGRVLCHCANGSNRSATVAIALAMDLCGLELAAAWAIIHSRHSQTAPLVDNCAELCRYEKTTRGKITMCKGRGGKLVKIVDQPPSELFSSQFAEQTLPAPPIIMSHTHNGIVTNEASSSDRSSELQEMTNIPAEWAEDIAADPQLHGASSISDLHARLASLSAELEKTDTETSAFSQLTFPKSVCSYNTDLRPALN